MSVELRVSTTKPREYDRWGWVNEETASYTHAVGVITPRLVVTVSWDQERKLRRLRAESNSGRASLSDGGTP